MPCRGREGNFANLTFEVRFHPVPGAINRWVTSANVRLLTPQGHQRDSIQANGIESIGVAVSHLINRNGLFVEQNIRLRGRRPGCVVRRRSSMP
jgi:hypothetical protein